MLTRIKAALVASATLAALVAGTAIATPAQAAVTDCALGNFCIWTGYGYTGTRYTYAKNSIDAGTNHGVRLGTLASNHGRSFYNHTTVAINIYDNGACGYNPWTRTMTSGQFANAQGSDWGDRVSSIQIESYAPNC